MEAKQQEAYKTIGEKVKAAYDLIREAEKIADEAQVSFSFSLEYGMGGTYYPKKDPNAPKTEDSEDDDWYESSEGWLSSSSQC